MTRPQSFCLVFRPFVLPLALYAALSLALWYLTGSLFPMAMAWNVLLAALPLVFASLLRGTTGHRLLSAAFALLWLLFFPNAPYMITDLMHLGGYAYKSSDAAERLLAWTTLLHVASGAMLSLLMGLVSLRIVHRRLIRRRGGTAGWIGVTLVSLVSGYAIYIGRFLRFNSWDVVRPVRLLAGLAGGLTLDTAAFSLVFSAYIFVAYGVFAALLRSQPAVDGEGDDAHAGYAPPPH